MAGDSKEMTCAHRPRLPAAPRASSYRPFRRRSRPRPPRGGPATSGAARTRFSRYGTGSRTCCRTARPGRRSSCWPASCARTPSSTAAAGRPAVSSAWISTGRPPWPGSSSGIRARPRSRRSPGDPATRARWASPGAGWCLSTIWRTTGERPAAPNRRWVWADVRWEARGGPLLAAPGGTDAAIASNTMVRKAFPGSSIWWGHQTRTWWAAVPGSTNAHGLICAPTSACLIQSLVRTYPRAAG